MKNLPSTICLLWVLLFVTSHAHASVSIRATAHILVTKHTLGDNIRVLVETEAPKDYTIEPPSEKTDVAPFELKKVEASPVARGKNRVRRTFIVHVTAFEKGTLIFPSMAVRWRSPSGQSGEVQTDPIEVEIVGVGKRPSDKDDIRAIKGSETFGSRVFWTALEAILAAILVMALAVKIFLRRLRRRPEDESTQPPHVRARLELDRLQEQGLPAQGKTREHAAQTADVLRRYTERRFGVEAMEKTTAELSDSMKSKGLDRILIEKIRGTLERADRVKFAKEEPSRADLDEASRAVLEIIDETTPAQPDAVKKNA